MLQTGGMSVQLAFINLLQEAMWIIRQAAQLLWSVLMDLRMSESQVMN